tara:strand:- start:3292 stop:3921 length:630 start_codon:yes stop_codon:yes gene_type:complete
MSNNVSTASDNSGNFEDWIELYNTTNSSISTKGLFLTDWPDSNLLKWELPNYIIPANSYFIIWADEDGNQGARHANFQLSNLGEQLILSNSDSSVIDSITYVGQLDDISYGRSPNGNGIFTSLIPTFKANNDFPNSVDDIVEDIIVYPNPFLNILYFKEKENVEVRDILGKIIFSSVSSNQIETSAWDTGVYFISLKERKKTLKVIKIK